ncbi:hypothetical protein JCM10449v2_007695 [Rhodotorula kratochvilovae]
MSSSHSGRSPHHATGSSSFDVSSLSNALPSTSERRMRQQTFAKPPSPSSGYLAVASEAPSTLDPSAGVAAEPLVRSTKGSTMPIVRPYLSTFLEYLCGSHLHPAGEGDHPARAFEPIVYSAAHAHNVLTLLRAVGVVPPLAAAGDDGAYRPREGEGDVLRAVLSRESMGMVDADYRRDVQAVKDLGKVWSELGLEEKDGTRRTVLLEEEEPAAAAQPYSRLPITPFLVSNPSSTLSRPSVRELPCSSADDPALLITIHFLELLRSEKNAPAALKAGLVRRGEDAAREAVRAREGRGEREEVGGREVSEEMARKGREVCERHGVEVRREWSGAWRERVVQARKEREGRGQESTGKA